MIELSHAQIHLLLQLLWEKRDRLEADRGYADDRTVKEILRVEDVQDALKEGLL